MAIDIDILKITTRKQYLGAITTYPFDLSKLETKLSATATGATWSTASDVVTVGTSGFASSIASCPITAVKTGDGLVKIVISFDNGDSLIHYFQISVEDPI